MICRFHQIIVVKENSVILVTKKMFLHVRRVFIRRKLTRRNRDAKLIRILIPEGLQGIKREISLLIRRTVLRNDDARKRNRLPYGGLKGLDQHFRAVACRNY